MPARKKKRTEKPIFAPAPSPRIDFTPSILSADFGAMNQELARCRRARARWIHIDVMDGHFVPNLTLGPPLIRRWREAEPDLFFDTHLMIEEPMRWAERFQEAGSQLITFHVEAVNNAKQGMKTLRRMGLKAGISIKPATPVRAIRDCLELADLILVMTVEPGFGGQALIPKALNKVRELDLLRREHGLPFRLQVDGGITKKTAPLAVAAGADVLVAGTAVFGGGPTVAENLKTLRETILKVTLKPKGRSRRAPSKNKPTS